MNSLKRPTNDGITQICTGCTACYAICPHNAITLKKCEDGFVYPYVNQEQCQNCGLCKGVCPQNSTAPTHTIDCYACYSTNKDIREKSSSGGIFSELAISFLKTFHGIVYGAALSEQGILRHIGIDNEKNLYLLRGSKYLQSSLSDVFVQIKTNLKKDVPVLFSGTPCQIAGLKRYLGKDDTNLYTIDVFCHGVPSPLVLEKFLSEHQYRCDGSLKFRDKLDGWNQFALSFAMRSGKYSIPHMFDIYFYGFLSNLFLRRACHTCKYNHYSSRVGDISIGDFWDVETSVGIQDNMGVNAVILNTEKGQKLFLGVKQNLVIYPSNIEQMIKGNPILVRPVLPHKNRELFFSKLSTSKNVTQLIKDSLRVSGTVGILNHSFSNDNFGALMVAYSMEQIVLQMGFSPLTVNLKFPGKENPQFAAFKKQHLHLSKRYNTRYLYFYNSLRSLNKKCDIFVVGSDQVWRNWWGNQAFFEKFFLDFADEKKNLIAYGASFGISKFQWDAVVQSRLKCLLSSFSAVSVRELDGIKICKNIFNLYAQVVLDPTLLLTKEQYEDLIEESDKVRVDKDYVFSMIFPEENNTAQLYVKLQEFAIKNGWTIKDCFNQENPIRTISEWLYTLSHSKFNIVDSYHGLIFSIIFQKEFICLINNEGGASRFTSILKLLGIDGRLFHNVNEVPWDKILNTAIDYESVNKRLEALSSKSRVFLQNALKRRINFNSKHYYNWKNRIPSVKTLVRKIVHRLIRIIK